MAKINWSQAKTDYITDETQSYASIAKKYGVDIKAVLVPIAEEFMRQTGTEISPGSALEVDGEKDKVLILYGDAVAGE